MAVGSSDLNRGLLEGSVGIPGVELVVRAYPSPERHWRMLRNAEFDVAEVSVGAFLAVNARDPGRFVAVPAFPHRRFRHSYVFVAADSPLTSAEQLRGGRIGLRTWTNTAGVWTRGILQDEYGVDLHDVTWVMQDEDTAGLSRREGFTLERVPAGESVVSLTARGELDALVYPEMPDVLGRPDGLRRLFSDSRAEEESYFRKAANFPIMHTVMLRAELVEQNPWLASDMLTAFRTSNDAALAAIADPRKVALTWARDTYEAQRTLMGDDPWAYDAESSRPSQRPCSATRPSSSSSTRPLRWRTSSPRWRVATCRATYAASNPALPVVPARR